MAVSKEVFANCASCVAAAGSGGTNGTSSPSSGTTETWTMSTGNGSFPAAQTTNTPNTYFYVTDPADTTHEIILVTDNSTPTSWHVTRGALSTVPVAHASGATYVQVVSHGTLQNFKQTPSASTTAVTVANTTNETILAVYQPTSDELVGGATWEAIAFGTYGVLSTGTRPTVQFALYWGGSGSIGGTYTSTGGAALTKILTGTNALGLVTTIASGASFDANGTITWLSSTTATANLNLFYQNGTLTVAGTSASSVNATTGGASSATAVTISGSGPLFLTAKWSAASASNTLTATAPVIYRAA